MCVLGPFGTPSLGPTAMNVCRSWPIRYVDICSSPSVKNYGFWVRLSCLFGLPSYSAVFV